VVAGADGAKAGLAGELGACGLAWLVAMTAKARPAPSSAASKVVRYFKPSLTRSRIPNLSAFLRPTISSGTKEGPHSRQQTFLLTGAADAENARLLRTGRSEMNLGQSYNRYSGAGRLCSFCRIQSFPGTMGCQDLTSSHVQQDAGHDNNRAEGQAVDAQDGLTPAFDDGEDEQRQRE